MNDKEPIVDEEKREVPLPRMDLRILQSLRRIIRCTELHSRHLAAEYKVTGPQLVCLHTIKEFGSITAKVIASEMFVSPSTVVGVLDRLEEKGFVLRERDRGDRRAINVSLTDKGSEFLREAPPMLGRKLYQALQELPEQDQSNIALSLERVVELMEAQDVEAEPLLEAGPIEQSAEGKALISKLEEIS